MANFEEHLCNPDVTIEDHIGHRSQELSRSLHSKTAVYLDLCFWVRVREVAEGIRTDTSSRKLVHHLMRLTRSGQIFCPISDCTFFELVQIGQPERRTATVRMIEALSCGVTLLPEPDRIESEIEDLVFGSVTPKLQRRTPQVWTRLAYVLGNTHVAHTPFPDHVELAIQKAFFDHLWEIPFSEFLKVGDLDELNKKSIMAEIAKRSNVGNRAHATQMKSFESVLSDEMGGMAEVAEPFLLKVICAAYQSYTGRLDTPERLQNQAGLNLIRACLLGSHFHRLPTLHIHGSLHALIRWDHRDKLLTSNDVFDIRHASAALAYCDAFLTDSELARSIKHRRIKLDHRHGCFVTSSVDEALDFLMSSC